MTVIYVAKAIATGDGRNGHVETSDGKIALDLAYPREIGGGGAGANPEQLVAMCYAACFSEALSSVARRRRVRLAGIDVSCQVKLHRVDGQFSLSFEIAARLPGLAVAEATSLVDEAHTFCPYSKAFTLGADAKVRAVT
jgi:lipoyl-dependent peroxiredoxin